MIANDPSRPAACALRTSLGEKLLDLLASPGDVFDEVAKAPAAAINWRLPTLLVCATNVILLNSSRFKAQAAAVLGQIVTAQKLPASDAGALSADFQSVAILTACTAAFAGTFWSAFVMWFIGRNFLKVRFSYWKSLEVAGLAGTMLVLGAILTFLLTTLSDNPGARPSPAIFLLKLHSNDRLLAALDVLNPFYLWTVTLLALGLSKLGATTFKESAFWVFGFWVVLRIALILLAG